MGQFQATTTPEQREALARAVVEAGMTVEQALAEAGFGNLPHPRDPAQTVGTFTLSRARAYDIIKRFRDDREAEQIKGTPELALRLDEMARRVTVLAEKELRKLESEDRAGKPMHVGRLKSVATVIRTLTLAKPPPYRPKRQGTEESKPEPEQPDLLTRLATTETSNGRAEPTPETSDANNNGDADESGTNPRFVSGRASADQARARLTAPS